VSYEQAEVAFREKRFDDAVALFNSYIEQKPANAWGHYMLGLSAWKAGDNRTAESAYEVALSIDPRHVQSLLGLGRVLIEEGRADEALQEIEFAAEVDPSSSQVFRLMGRAYHELGRADDAIAAYSDAIALDDTDVWALNNLGYLYIQTSQHSEAIGPLARAVELAPDMAMFQNNLGIALERIGYAGSAAEAFRAAVAADATYVKAQVNLERVEARGVDLDIVADLAYHAQRFMDEVVGWRNLAVGEFELDTVPPDDSYQEEEQPEPTTEPETITESMPEPVTSPDSTGKVEVPPDSIPQIVQRES
jgi:Flp pilus assembly protein TadD